jgi:hypothetical protein
VAALAQNLALTQSCGGPPYSCQHYLLTTSGNSAELFVGPSEYPKFLGSIDTPAEALLMAFDGTFGGYQVRCDAPSVRPVEDGYEVVVLQMIEDCAPIVQQRVLLHIDRDGNRKLLRSNIASVTSACVGRRSESLTSSVESTGQAVADFFASIAHLEAASVDAFDHLRDELALHGADEELLADVLQARDDEVRHAQMTAELARKFGGSPQPPRVEPLPLRDLERIACENAAEGCVRETFGALVATYQASASSDSDVARALAEIAQDETRHAALAWRIATWLDDRLSDSARERVRLARARAIAELRDELSVSVPDSLRRVAGVPDAENAIAWLAELERTLWSSPARHASS